MLRNIGKIFSFLLISVVCHVAHAADTITVNGSGSALDMMKPIISAYKKADPKVQIVMGKPLGSSGAIKALLAGAIDIAVSSKPIKPEESRNGALVKEYGKTPLLFATNMKVKKMNITASEIEEMYAGKQTTWPDGTTVRLVLRPEGDIDTTIIRGISPGVNSAVSMAMKRPGMILSVTDPEAVAAISSTDGAIGAVCLSTMMVEKPGLNTLFLNGVKGTTQNLSDGSYPLGKDIRFVTTSGISPAASKFLDFVYSAKGRAIAGKAGVLVTVPAQVAR